MRFGIWQLTSLYNYFYINSSAELSSYFHYQILKYSLFAGQVQTSSRAASERISASLIRGDLLSFGVWKLNLLCNCFDITSKAKFVYTVIPSSLGRCRHPRSAPPPRLSQAHLREAHLSRAHLSQAHLRRQPLRRRQARLAAGWTPGINDPHPSTLNPHPSTLNPHPSTLNTQHSTLNPPPAPLNPQPSTLNPQPSTLNPQPSTRASRAGGPGAWGWRRCLHPGDNITANGTS